MSKSHSLGTWRCVRPPGITIPSPAHCRMEILYFFLFPEDFYAYSQGLRGAELKKQAQTWFKKQSTSHVSWGKSIIVRFGFSLWDYCHPYQLPGAEIRSISHKRQYNAYLSEIAFFYMRRKPFENRQFAMGLPDFLLTMSGFPRGLAAMHGLTCKEKEEVYNAQLSILPRHF